MTKPHNQKSMPIMNKNLRRIKVIRKIKDNIMNIIISLVLIRKQKAEMKSTHITHGRRLASMTTKTIFGLSFKMEFIISLRW